MTRAPVRLAAVDIGTNSVRLLVAHVRELDDGPEVVTLDRRMQITRLGQGVDSRRRLAASAMDRTVKVLREYRNALDELGAARVRVVATSAARDAANRDEFFAAVAETLGTEPELLTGEEEAALSFAGATAELAAPAPYLVVDIGGGSTELVVGRSKPEGLVSVELGCVRLTEQFLGSDPPEGDELAAAAAAVRERLERAAPAVPGARDARTLVGLAGTITSLAAIEQGLARYDRDRVHHFVLTRSAVESLLGRLAGLPLVRRRELAGLEPERADVIVGGVLVLAGVLEVFGHDEVLVSEADILDGLVRSLLA